LVGWKDETYYTRLDKGEDKIQLNIGVLLHRKKKIHKLDSYKE